jgi:sugar phosphate isomerase/epimerase
MSYREYLKIGLNHHLLYKKLISGPKDHARTLNEVIKDKRLEILDIWIPEEEPYRTEEIKLLKESGKDIYYNVGTRKGKEAAHPSTLSPEKRKYSIAFYKDEISRGIEAGCKKIIANSGPDVPDNRKEAFEALVDFFCEICSFVPKDVIVMIEPTDREMDKKKLIGPSSEAVMLAQRIHSAGCKNFASMVDMCHIPLMGEKIEHAMNVSKGYIRHIHLGNCIIKDKQNPLYGDKHPAWGLKDSEYDVEDIAKLLKTGIETRYFSKENRGSASFEMMAYEDMTPAESVDRFFEYLGKAWEKVEKDFELT